MYKLVILQHILKFQLMLNVLIWTSGGGSIYINEEFMLLV